MLELRVLGELEVVRDGAPVMLPPSRKTRALLAYLALTRRTHRRERLCEIFWDVPDDPRGALRWSLSKIRPLVDDPGCSRLVADRQTVELLTEALDLDFFDAQACAGAEAPATGELARAASSFRGPLLADLDLPLNTEFHTWLVGLREDARKLQLQILRALTERLAATPQEALPYVRELVRIDPYDEAGWALLISNLAAVGRGGEARQQYEAATRILREVGGGSGPLLRAWRTAQASATRPADRDTTKTEPVAAEPIAARVAMTSSSAQPAPPPRASIVVLPFANLSNDPEQQYFADGITGNLTTDLSRIPDMLVISRNTAFTYRNKPVDTKQIGRELGVRYVLEGEVQRSASRVRVTAQLIDAETDVHLWAERFDGDAGDLFALQDEITNRIAVALDLELVGAEAMRPTVNRDTQDYILRGRAVRLKPPSRENRAEAVALFERALSLDQDSAAAQSWLAIALTARALDSMADTAAADIARGRLGRAGLGRGAAQLGRAFRQRSGATGAAAARRGHPRIRDRHRAQPQLGPLYSHLGWCKFMTGSIEALIPAQERAIRLSPRDPQIGLFYSRIGCAHLLQSRLDEAIVWCQRARNATPAHPQFRTFLTAAYALKSDNDRAAAELTEARGLVGDDRYSSIARLRAVDSWGVPKIRALVEATYFAGLRKAGVPDE